MKAARKRDISTPDPCGARPRPNKQGSPNVNINGRPAHRVGDAWVVHACPKRGGHGAVTVQGSPNVFINGKPAARVSDLISCGSRIAEGSENVNIN
jgi:uncharacterized Zn-binding protein involved in type VI secretion